MSLGIGNATARTFMSLRRHYNYRLYFFGQVVSISGTWMQSVAQAWFVVQNTHSPLAVGILAVCQFGPYGLFGLFGGAVADRLDQRKVLLGTQAAFMVTAALLAGLTLTGHATVWEVYVIAGVTGMITVLDTPVRQAFTIQMVGRDELPNAVALNSSLFNASRIVGPAIAGGLIAVAGVGICFLINALSYLAVLAALWLMRVHDLFPVSRDQRHENLLRGSLEGLKFAWRKPVIRSVLVMMLVIATVSINFNVLLPVLASRTLNSGPGIFGILSALFGFGALVGALFSASLGRASRRTMIIGAAMFSVSEIALAPLSVAWAAGLALVVTGIAFTLYSSQANATLQLAVTDQMRGRVLGIYGYVFFGTAPLGGLLAGWLAEVGGTKLAFLVAGLIAAAATIYGWADTGRAARASTPPIAQVA
ncbi:MAG TPA: MFS transporter [Candidatus Saccharimonadales bacterium]|nr:MFS transporter [Candidatus Saccharimonadales bacterium]